MMNFIRLIFVSLVLLLVSCRTQQSTAHNDMEVLIIFYDAEVGNIPLTQAVKKYGATIVYRYQKLNGMAISVPKRDATKAIAYFGEVRGVLAVMPDEMNTLH